ncbi:hypothetical protein HIM_09389 [Hirsutella minnesotensis 3608]|uniref:Uncharacterized protein n=1 Tax=Hirsutella minnesotensis 3608 TaxID=1043627 RepID=A0A0F7ZGP4_9HYPO|nr:hypothetical protein HIM_09389 [Hirsutella minnesotensis 3608]
MALDLPGVEPVALESKSEFRLGSVSQNVANDYGTPNLLFLYYIPFLPDDKKVDLDAIKDEFQTWNAWELGQAESQLIQHVENGNLPSDDSIASRITRNDYRSKAINFFRLTSQAWLKVATEATAKKSAETTKDTVNGVIIQELWSLAREEQLQTPFSVVLNSPSGSIDINKENKLFYTHVYYQYDHDSRTFRPVVQDTTFTIKVLGGSESKSEKDNVTVEIALSTVTYNFDRKFWRDNRHQGQAAITSGEPIREQMALDFFVDS